MRKPKVSTAKKRAWTAFSRYIRLREADDNGYVSCVTCGTTRHWQDGIHAGHFIAKSRGNAIYMHPENVHPQCVRCNLHLHGNLIQYTLYMIEQYGQEKISELEELARTTVKFTADDWLEIETEYKEKADSLIG